MDYVKIAKEVLEIEAQSIFKSADNIDTGFNDIVDVIANSSGRLVISGMGKSGHIGKKIFATLISTGTPSLFIHPGEAFHGDLGMIMPEDTFFAISNSGETEEIVRLIPFLKDNGNTIIAMTGNVLNSSLADAADYVIDVSVEREACPLNLAPTSSTTVTLALGDSLAVALMYAKQFSQEGFARFHPGGSLGKKLLGTVSQYSEYAEVVSPNAKFSDIIKAIGLSKAGIVVVALGDELKGVITSGDLNRAIARENIVITNLIAEEMMCSSPCFVTNDIKCKDANALMASKKINSLVIHLNDEFLVYNNFNG